MDWEKYGYTIASKYRTKVVVALSQKPKTPSEIAGETGLYISHASSTISDLIENNIIKCLTPSLKRGKVFDLTSAGKEVAAEIKKRQR